MRIAFLTDFADPLAPIGGQQAGGVNTYIYELARSLSRIGIKVDVFTRWDSTKSSQTVRFAERAKVVRIKAGPRHFLSKNSFGAIMPEYIEHFLEYCREKKMKYDLIHSHYYFAGWAGIQVKNIFQIPLVHSYHALGLTKREVLRDSDPSPTDRIQVEKEILEAADEIIASSPQDKMTLIEGYGFGGNKISIIPAGVNLHRFSPLDRSKARLKLGIASDRKVIVFAGNMNKNKGAEVLIRSVREIKRRWSKLSTALEVYLLTGDPRKSRRKEKDEADLRHHLKTLIKDLRLADVIRLDHSVTREKLHYYYGAANVVVMPSFYESFGMVATEAMATGTPVVASDVGGLKWTIQDGINGFHAKPGDAKDFAIKIAGILQNPDLEDRLSKNAVIYARNNFDWDKIAKKILSQYERLTGKDQKS